MNIATIIAGAAVAVVLAAGVARADCTSDITRLKASSQTVANPQVRKLVEFDITRALKEAGEADDDECKEAIDHADKLMASAKPAP